MAGPAAPPVYDTDLPSPSFCVDVDIASRNCERMRAFAAQQGLALRPHVKTHKTLDGALLQCGAVRAADCAIVVSTLAEAEHFAALGVPDMLYGVPIEPSKLARAWRLHAQLPSFHVLIDGAAALAALASAHAAHGALAPAAPPWSVFLAVDATGYGREGAPPGGAATARLARAIAAGPGTALAGIYSHSGNAYNCGAGCGGDDARAGARAIAGAERDSMYALAAALRAAGVAVPVVSMGATPSACAGSAWAAEGACCSGAELHPGNYIFFDRQQIASGSCAREDVACYVLSRVVAVRASSVLIDAGGCALHKDSGGLRDGEGWGELLVDGGGGGGAGAQLVLQRMTQELSVVARRDGEPLEVDADAAPLLPLGSVVRVVPNHSCMTAAMHAAYHAVRTDAATGKRRVVGIWTPCKGW